MVILDDNSNHNLSLNENDIVAIYPNGEIILLYRQGWKDVTLFFTNQCNMDCTYCYECNKMVRSTSYDVLDGIENFIVEKQRSCSDKTVSIVTHGGEPLIEFDKIQYLNRKLNFINI